MRCRLVVHVFTKMLMKYAYYGHVAGLFQQLRPNGVIRMKYTNHTLINLEMNSSPMRYLKWILSCFGQTSEMRISFSVTPCLSTLLLMRLNLLLKPFADI